MPLRVTEKLTFLSGELSGLRSRIGGNPNACQAHKLDMLSDIYDDYRKSAERAAAVKGENE